MLDFTKNMWLSKLLSSFKIRKISKDKFLKVNPIVDTTIIDNFGVYDVVTNVTIDSKDFLSLKRVFRYIHEGNNIESAKSWIKYQNAFTRRYNDHVNPLYDKSYVRIPEMIETGYQLDKVLFKGLELYNQGFAGRATKIPSFIGIGETTQTDTYVFDTAKELDSEFARAEINGHERLGFLAPNGVIFSCGVLFPPTTPDGFVTNCGIFNGSRDESNDLLQMTKFIENNVVESIFNSRLPAVTISIWLISS